jgi:hypothetical protein
VAGIRTYRRPISKIEKEDEGDDGGERKTATAGKAAGRTFEKQS